MLVPLTLSLSTQQSSHSVTVCGISGQMNEGMSDGGYILMDLLHSRIVSKSGMVNMPLVLGVTMREYGKDEY